MNRNVTATILIVLAVGIYVTVTSAKWAEVKEVKAVNDQYISAIDNADKLVKVRDEVLKNYNSISADHRERLDKMIPNTVDNIRLVIDLNSVAQRHGFSLRNIKASASSAAKSASVPVKQDKMGAGGSIPTPTLDTVAISFSVSAPYQKFIDLMRDLEANLRIMEIKRLDVSANTTGIYDFSVELETYWLRQQ